MSDLQRIWMIAVAVWAGIALVGLLTIVVVPTLLDAWPWYQRRWWQRQLCKDRRKLEQG